MTCVCSNYLQYVPAGIFLPAQVEVAVSDDGKQFRVAATVTHDVPPKQAGPLVHRFVAKLKDVAGRYVRIRASNIKTIPDWHPARGKKAWLFVDEIVVNGR
jgi:hexosaminidase